MVLVLLLPVSTARAVPAWQTIQQPTAPRLLGHSSGPTALNPVGPFSSSQGSDRGTYVPVR